VGSLLRRAAAAPALAAAAALLVSGCGGAAGVSDTIARLVPAACAIEHAGVEDSNYASALTNVINDFPFTGLAEDDLSNPANRRRIFTARIDELRAQVRTVATLTPSTDLERRLVSAAKRDLSAMIQAMNYDLRWPPGDPNAPPSADLPTSLGDTAQTASDAVRSALNKCPALPDQERRTKAYSG
jgi:hypothetical protein